MIICQSYIVYLKIFRKTPFFKSVLHIIYSRSDVNKLLTYIESLKPEMYELAIRMFFNLFLRIGELKALKWEDINWEDRTIYVHRQLLIEPGYTKNMGHAPRKHVSTTMRYLRNVNQTDDCSSLFKALGRAGAKGAEA